MDKAAHYRRAVWLSDNPDTLAKVLKNSFDKVSSGTLPTFNTRDGLDCVVARRSVAQEPYFFHFVVYEGGAPAAVIAALTKAAELDAAVTSPPDDHEFIQSQLFCVVRENHVVWTTHNTPMRERGINALFYSLIESLLGHGDKTQFEFQAKLDRNAFKSAFDSGIEEIDLGVGDFRSTLEAINSDGAVSGLGPLGSLVKRKLTQQEIEAAANIFGKVVLRPKKNWKKPAVMGLLSEVASNVLEGHEDEFVIKTKSGLRLTRTKMSVHRNYNVQGDRRVLSPAEVQTKLLSILTDWDDAGLLE